MQKLNIGILGYGKMGKEIELIAKERGHNIGLIVDLLNSKDLNIENLKNIDVCLEFTNSDVVVENIRTCFEHNIPVVSGTTGWHTYFEKIVNECTKKKCSFFYSANFSIGMNIFFGINDKLAELMKFHPDYDVDITEIHHTQKLDKPSGTAIVLANHIIDNIGRKTEWKLSENVMDNEIKISSVREGSVPGTHIVKYTSKIDEIEIKHISKSRRGLALGAILAAEFIVGKTGFYTMKDLLKF